ncbi:MULTISPECIES: hypothetical protein [unclassified Bradyrhizobium]|uniref:hypothetical protein n=1 Tax=unclassified Bradyrhizobium TaxID=2631580 RepID=UPI0028E6D40E|nr:MULTISPECIES: hypothetical protein [unclassified Bradyrhizobium]
MKLPRTSLNEELSAAIKSRIGAEEFYILGRSGFWRAIGVGFIALGLETTIGLGLYGYSSVTRSEENLSVMAAAISKALADIQVRGSAIGTIEIQPSEIRLARDQTVILDESSRIRLDPATKIFADGEMRVQAPTVSVPLTVTPRARTTTPTITNFTVFKSVPFDKGSVQTGWVFLTSAQKFPTTQYCYYTESGDNPDVSLRIELGKDEQSENEKNVPAKFALAAAFAKCVWFRKDAL